MGECGASAGLLLRVVYRIMSACWHHCQAHAVSPFSWGFLHAGGTLLLSLTTTLTTRPHAGELVHVPGHQSAAAATLGLHVSKGALYAYINTINTTWAGHASRLS